jgi:V-type H+-transporting ATPase subunit a
MYKFGIDPIWFRSTNEIAIMNSFKMKISVIFGVAQMLLGTVMKGFNAVFFKDWIELVFEVITQALLLIVLFGFMDYMIIAKWLTNWEDPDSNSFQKQGEIAPGIINTMIVMFIQMGVKPEVDDGSVVQSDLMDNQKTVMRTCLAIAGICVPAMLIVKPLYVKFTSKKAKHGDFDKIVGDEMEMAAINPSL